MLGLGKECILKEFQPVFFIIQGAYGHCGTRRETQNLMSNADAVTRKLRRH